MTEDLSAICAESGVEMIPKEDSCRRGPNQTCAGQTLARILEKRGPANLRQTIMTIVETRNNNRQLVAPVIWAVSDLLAAYPDWVGSAWFDAFDEIELAEVHKTAKLNKLLAKPRQAIATMLFGMLAPKFIDKPQGRLI